MDGLLYFHGATIDPVNGLELQDLDSQQLLADTDALLLPNKGSPRRKAGQRRDAYRKCQKEERAILQVQDAELSRQLAKLQQFKRQEATQSAPGDTLALGAWKAIAIRQYESRMESEALQKRLRAAVNNRALMIQDLDTLLRKRMREVEKLTSVEGDSDLYKKKTRLGTKDAMLYKIYFENLDALYERIDEVFQEVGVTPTPGGILSRDDWEREEYYGFLDQENSLALKYSAPHQNRNGEVFNLATCHVARRYVEKTRMVMVWRALCEADEGFPGLNSDETGSAVVHAPTSGAHDPTTTLVQACIRIVRMHFHDGSSEKEGKADQFMELPVKTGVEDNEELGRMMEKLLLDDALATEGLFDKNGDLF
ncbi:hypothetical protein ON010_g6696 [Phytophthora cinnamomi]|nr:hypothetical protein ON010_g6696 [Phytophthora cinnamomi]